MPRKIRDLADAKGCLCAWEASGASLSTWARAHGIDGRSLHCWKMNLAGRREPAGFLELVGPADEAVVEPDNRRRTGRYTLRFERLEVEVGDDFDEDTLQRLLNVVAPC